MSYAVIRVMSRDEDDNSDDFLDTKQPGEMTLWVENAGIPGPTAEICVEGRIHTFWLHELWAALAVEHQGREEAP